MIELTIQIVKEIYFKLNYSSINRRDFKDKNVADKANWVKFKGHHGNMAPDMYYPCKYIN